ncbi:hypothetical protein NDI37_26675 [Funiculus sociatus GB2-A5]|jgi:hypothetical protein|uniref:Uncharacterized protein n=1 Tax=Funiculus sociatus GB2-A5 TaxID=2933946 RepID=A0ABV0JZJ8_9CYAN|nr:MULTISPECIES: hypothetical protein [unclassified Trichocoleus]MBD1907401.1 hypothetical protein [Trichocoleus sp. FACHB-832]MBD2063738.1 hypothetical protein [Trichocoleus sp. FACHB-6]
MTQKQRLPIELAKFFRARLQAITYRSVFIPEMLEFGKIYRFSDDDDMNSISFTIVSAPTPYLDYFQPYEEHRAHARISFHGRISATGEELELENYQGEWGRPFYDGDSARTAREQEEIGLHNQSVNAILRKKGLA